MISGGFNWGGKKPERIEEIIWNARSLITFVHHEK